jgi:short subunit dehydrogenase-like uncharacterized protein
MAGDRDFDVVVFGATGFVGRLVASYLARHAPGGLRIGFAGRSEARLAAVRTAAAASTWPLVLADSTDAASLARLANAARVVVSTVGPYRRHGLALVEACAKAGTHYADLAGELLFMRESIDRYGAVAAGTGARIVHCCGVDSVPSDLGVLLLHRAAAADGAGDLEDTTLLVKAFKGGFSGGTLATMKLQLEEVRANPESRGLVDDPYALSPDRVAEPQMSDESDLMWIRHDGDLNSWIGPFVMAGVNTRVVRRSNALQGWAYGRRFRYREVTHFGSGAAAAVKASAAGIGMLSFRAGLSYRPTRVLLDRVLPAPGAGPNEKARQAGSVRMELHTHTSGGAHYSVLVAAQGDPGYTVSSLIIGEAALGLALDLDRLPRAVGVLTPATALGTLLVARLKAAGVTMTTRRNEPYAHGPTVESDASSGR